MRKFRNCGFAFLAALFLLSIYVGPAGKLALFKPDLSVTTAPYQVAIETYDPATSTWPFGTERGSGGTTGNDSGGGSGGGGDGCDNG